MFLGIKIIIIIIIIIINIIIIIRSCKQKPNFLIFPFSKFCKNASRCSFTLKIVFTNYDGLDSGNFLEYDAPPAGCFKKEVENVNHNFKTNLGDATNIKETQSRNVINICTKYGCDILIISGRHGGHNRLMTYDRQQQGYSISATQADEFTTAAIKKIC